MKTRINFWIENEQLKKLKVLSEKTGARISALVRKSIQEYLKRK